MARGGPASRTEPELTSEGFGDREDVAEVVQLSAAGWRGPADEVENLAVLERVVGKPLDAAVLVEIDGDHALARDFGIHERDALLGALGDVIERLAADGCDGGGCSEHDQHLLLARANRDLLERALLIDVAPLVNLREIVGSAAGQRKRQRNGQQPRGGARRKADLRAQFRGRHFACIRGAGGGTRGALQLQRRFG